MTEIRAIGTRRTNAELMADCAQLGYLPEPVLDLTYGLGRFWKKYRPACLTTNDIDSSCLPMYACDYRDCQVLHIDGGYGAVVFDPPYKLNGTSIGTGPAVSDEGYGVAGDYRPVAQRHTDICVGIGQAAKLSSGFVLVKCQDQVVSGRVHWQTRIFADYAEQVCGLELIDMLHVQGYRKQPEGRRQVHARRDYSTLLVFKRV